MSMTDQATTPTRERLLHALYEAAELEHNLMCTYLYAAFSLRMGESEGLSAREARTVAAWRREIFSVATEEMGHLSAVWNITAALGGAPRFGRDNFPLNPGVLPAGVVVRLAPFNEATLQHFIYLERPDGSKELDGAGFEPELQYMRSVPRTRVTPMPVDYDTVGTFYAKLSADLRAFVDRVGEKGAFIGDPELQLSPAEVELGGARPVLCAKTALQAFSAIVRQGEGAPEDAQNSHYQRFLAILKEYHQLKSENPAFAPAWPAACNPVLRRPMRPQGRVWLENETAAAAVDVANSAYGLMLRLLAHCYTVPRPSPAKSLLVDLALGLMHAMTPLAEHAARTPAGPSCPGVNGGMSFTALRDSAALPGGICAVRFFTERFEELADAAAGLVSADAPRTATAARHFAALAARAKRELDPKLLNVLNNQQPAASAPAAAPAPAPAPKSPASKISDGPVTSIVDGVEIVEGEKLTLMFEAKRCIHARFCVTGAPKVFLANVQGPWIHPDAMDIESVVGIAHQCPSGAIRYRRKDGHADEAVPPVNLISVREGGPYAVHADTHLDGGPTMFRCTLCRCGASKNKPYCDGSHHDVHFTATGEPPSGTTDMLPVRDGPLAIDPQIDGPLRVRGNMEIISGTGRVVARVTNALLCRCGGSANKPFCDGTHARIDFKSES